MLIDMFAAILAVLSSPHRKPSQEVMMFGLASIHGLVIHNEYNLKRSIGRRGLIGAKAIVFDWTLIITILANLPI